MHISASSGLHCPLLTNSSCGTRNAAGNRCPGVETSSPLPSLVDHPRQSQLEGLPWAGPLSSFLSTIFSTGQQSCVAGGALSPEGACAAPLPLPVPLLLLQPLGRAGEWQRQGRTQGGTKALPTKPRCLSPGDFSGASEASPCIRPLVISLPAPRGRLCQGADKPLLSRGTCQVEVSEHFVIVNRLSFPALTRGFVSVVRVKWGLEVK